MYDTSYHSTATSFSITYFSSVCMCCVCVCVNQGVGRWSLYRLSFGEGGLAPCTSCSFIIGNTTIRTHGFGQLELVSCQLASCATVGGSRGMSLLCHGKRQRAPPRESQPHRTYDPPGNHVVAAEKPQAMAV